MMEIASYFITWEYIVFSLLNVMFNNNMSTVFKMM